MDPEEARRGALLLTQFTKALEGLSACAAAIEATREALPGVDSVLDKFPPIQLAIGELITRAGGKIAGSRVGEDSPAQKIYPRPMWLEILNHMWFKRSVWMVTVNNTVNNLRISDEGRLQQWCGADEQWFVARVAGLTEPDAKWLGSNVPWGGSPR